MKYSAFFVIALAAQAQAQTLHYVINWPSGLNLGEASLSVSKPSGTPPPATPAAASVAPAAVQAETSVKPSGNWSFDLDIDAGVPGFALRDHYHSTAHDADICSALLDKKTQHGARKSQETDTFDQKAHTVTRESPGSKTDYSVSPCARDALAFLQFARKELAQGRLAPQQSVVLGGAYNVRLEVLGTQSVKMLDKMVQADRIRATIKGPASNLTVEIFFAKDDARTPVLAKIPLPLGIFTAELTR